MSQHYLFLHEAYWTRLHGMLPGWMPRNHGMDHFLLWISQCSRGFQRPLHIWAHQTFHPAIYTVLGWLEQDWNCRSLEDFRANGLYVKKPPSLGRSHIDLQITSLVVNCHSMKMGDSLEALSYGLQISFPSDEQWLSDLPLVHSTIPCRGPRRMVLHPQVEALLLREEHLRRPGDDNASQGSLVSGIIVTDSACSVELDSKCHWPTSSTRCSSLLSSPERLTWERRKPCTICRLLQRSLWQKWQKICCQLFMECNYNTHTGARLLKEWGQWSPPAPERFLRWS